MKSSTIVAVLAIVVIGAIAAPVPAQEFHSEKDVAKAPEKEQRAAGHHEVPNDAYRPAPRADRSTTPGRIVSRNDYVSVQVNVDAEGNNIVGDAANEPSIAVSPVDPTSMVIGWRQFDTISSDFRQAGYGYTADGGLSWTFPGVIEPGVFRSDPVLDADAAGNFYYNSLTANTGHTDFWCHVYISGDGGATFDAGHYAWGGDKQWQVIDTTDGIGQGNIYATWNQVFSTCSGNFTRSTDGGMTFEPCSTVAGSPYWGTMAVGPDGELYVSGQGFLVAKSSNAQDPAQSVQWDFSTSVSLGGSIQYSVGPNPGGLLGQAWIAVDHSDGPSRGNVYLLCSVDPPGADPMDVMFSRSTDGGVTWSPPVRVNQDPSGAWQWFGTMSVAPNGRIDVIWNDTRDDPGGYDSEVYYSYSTDTGLTWSPGVSMTPSYDPHIGWPIQNKMGDYYDMISDDFGADLAYAATFNGEQDVYYLRIGDPKCPEAGMVRLDRPKYACESTAEIQVLDCGLNTDDGLVEQVVVDVTSDAEPGGEPVTLTETGPTTAIFEGSLTLSETDAAGVLWVAPGDTVTVTYIDADDGEGGIDVIVAEIAAVDCTEPVITNVQTTDIGPFDATVTFDTDEPAAGTVRYGVSCAELSDSAAASGFEISHAVRATGLSENSTYFYAVDAEDEAGNAATDDNGGECYTFNTSDIPLYFTELFETDNDLDNISLTFVPNGSADFYDGCSYPITELPTDPAGGTTISLSDDDSELITLTDGASVWLYGESYTGVYAGSNGYLTLGGSDTDYTETLEDHFDMPRIAGVFDDMNPSGSGTVSYKQLSDRLAVTYESVPEYSTSNSNTFQFVLYFDGTIEINYLSVAIADGIAGLSEGTGVPPAFYENDLSALGSCGPRPPTAQSQFLTTPVSTPVDVTLVATDDGLPEPPALTYHVVALPANGSLSDPGVGTISAVPYDLSGDQVLYTPDFGYNGLDEFMFVANDGGVPPEGGDSNNGVITIEVGGPQPVISFPMDTDPGWDVEGQWAFGQPTGGGTHEGDPTSGYTGDNVYGYNLEGDYPANMSSTLYLTTTALDCTDLTGAELRFRRWLGVESSSYDHANLDISVDGSAWTTLWDHSGGAISESSWSEQVFDISGYADGQPTVYLRWGMGPTDGSVQYPGWNIDDVEIWGYAPPAGAAVTMGWSCQEHGDNGEFCLELGNGDARGTGDNVEPRLAPIAELEFDVAAPVESFEATVSCGVDTAYAAVVTALADGGSTVTVQLDPPLPAADCCTITFSGGVFDQYSIATLAGSVNRDLVVNTLDFSAIKARFGQVSDASNFWYDVNADGVINTIDSSGVKARFGHSLPSCP